MIFITPAGFTPTPTEVLVFWVTTRAVRSDGSLGGRGCLPPLLRGAYGGRTRNGRCPEGPFHQRFAVITLNGTGPVFRGLRGPLGFRCGATASGGAALAPIQGLKINGYG